MLQHYLSSKRVVNVRESRCLHCHHTITIQTNMASGPGHPPHRRRTMTIDMYKVQSKIRKWVVIRKVSWSGRRLQDLPRYYKDNADVVRAAVRQDSRALMYASDRLRDDKTTVMTAMKKKVHDQILIDVSLRLRDDRDVVLAAVKSLGYYHGADILQYASPRLRSDTDFLRLFLRYTRIKALEWVSIEIRDDEQFMMALVKRRGEAIRYASCRLKDNYWLGYQSVSNNGLALKYISLRLQNDVNIAKRAIVNNVEAVRYVGDGIKNSSVIVETVINIQPTSFWDSFGYEIITNPKHIVYLLERTNDLAGRFPRNSTFGVYFHEPKYVWGDDLDSLPFPPSSSFVKSRLYHLLNGEVGTKHDEVLYVKRSRDWPSYEARVKDRLRSKWETIWLIGQLHDDFVGQRDIQNHIQEFVSRYPVRDLKELVQLEPLIETLLRLRLPLYSDTEL